MKNELKKYVFEIIVIFIGITISFVFESWRQGREDRMETKRQLTLLRNDLSRTKAWIEQIDSSYSEMIADLSLLRNGETMSEEDVSWLLFSIFDSPVDFPLRDLSPYLSQVAGLSESGISTSDKIITNISYIQTLVRVDYELNKSVSEQADSRLWPKLKRDKFFVQVLKAEKEWMDTTIVWTDKQYTIGMFDDIEADLGFVEMKLRKILVVHDALKRRIDILREDLEQV